MHLRVTGKLLCCPKVGFENWSTGVALEKPGCKPSNGNCYTETDGQNLVNGARGVVVGFSSKGGQYPIVRFASCEMEVKPSTFSVNRGYYPVARRKQVVASDSMNWCRFH